MSRTKALLFLLAAGCAASIWAWLGFGESKRPGYASEPEAWSGSQVPIEDMHVSSRPVGRVSQGSSGSDGGTDLTGGLQRREEESPVSPLRPMTTLERQRMERYGETIDDFNEMVMATTKPLDDPLISSLEPYRIAGYPPHDVDRLADVIMQRVAGVADPSTFDRRREAVHSLVSAELDEGLRQFRVIMNRARAQHPEIPRRPEYEQDGGPIRSGIATRNMLEQYFREAPAELRRRLDAIHHMLVAEFGVPAKGVYFDAQTFTF